MIFDLVHNFSAVLDTMPPAHPRCRILTLLDEAIRREVHFIDRHPTTLFQCVWNSCWWYDCPEAVNHAMIEGGAVMRLSGRAFAANWTPNFP